MGQYIASILSEEIEALGQNKVVAVVTDHAANMKKAWEILATKYPWILFKGCKTHMINLAAKDLAEKTNIANCLNQCSAIAKYFR
uniref:DUF659 domain-containing protein n=1 Tax=Ditylenchus dipsaci TaxID=166011 RepID=A0A915CZP7_9BILA